MKILVINSPLFRHQNDLYDEDSLPPLGLGYIATALQGDGHDVSLIDCVEERIALVDIISRINTYNCDVVALNIFTTNADLVKDIVCGVSIKVHFIIGGLSTKELHKTIVEWRTANQIDIVIGDGELICSDLVSDKVAEPPIYEGIGRRVYMVSGGSKYFVKDLDEPMLDRNFFVGEPVAHPRGFNEANIVTSRGCIFNCTFCAAARSLNTDFPIRERSVESIRLELAFLRETYPNMQSVRVLDDLFLKNARSINEAILSFDRFGLNWRSMAHVLTFNNVTLDSLIKLKEVGCQELFIGVESGSPKILKSINKTWDINKILDNLSRVMQAGISLKCYFIYGFPGETVDDMVQTLDLAKALENLAAKHKVGFRTSVFQYRPYHGTQIYHDLENNGENLDDVVRISPNNKLSNKVGRIQFNFHSVNVSEVDEDKVHEYIYRTAILGNNGDIKDTKGKSIKTE